MLEAFEESTAETTEEKGTAMSKVETLMKMRHLNCVLKGN